MTSFDELGLDPNVLKAVKEAGYESPTPIQAGAIPAALQSRDVLGIAQTGTGKTASFVLPMIHLLARGRARARMPRSLVLCPTRELAAQVAENFDTYAKYAKLTKALLIGGVSFKEQDRLIDRGVDVLIATPGRLLDHFERGKLLLTGVQIMVVDEADRMLDMGFIPDIERIFSLTPFTRQTLFFSATMAPEIERITTTFLQAPVKVEVARQATASETIAQEAIRFRPSRRDRAASEKRALLRAVIAREGDALSNAIVFCNRKVDVDILAKSLKKHGLDAAPIHGDLDQSQRMRTLEAFRDGELRLLVASDVAARGLDIPDVSHVFNFDVPTHPEDYVHRIGRTGRAGRSGKAITLVAPSDEKYLDAIEKLLGKPIPTGANPLDTTAAGESGPSPDTAAGRADEAGATRADDRGEDPVEGEAQTAQSRADSGRKRRSRGGRGRSARAQGAATKEDAAKGVTESDTGTVTGGATAPGEAAPAPSADAAAESSPAETSPPVTGPADTSAAEGDARRERPSRDRDRAGRGEAGRAESGRSESGRKESGRGESGRSSRAKGRGAPVVGMGDHLPSFIALSFDERRTS